jgi:hypothetical protein
MPTLAPDFLIYWGLAAIFVGFVGTARGRGFFTWAIISIGLSALIALIILLVTGDGQKRTECPACKERIIVGAALCPHCQTQLEWLHVAGRKEREPRRRSS